MNIKSVLSELAKDYGLPDLPEASIKTDQPMFELQAINQAVFILIWKTIEEHNYCNSIDLVEEFRAEMDQYACSAKTATANLIFSAAYDVATYVLEALCKEVSL